jgi:hypothetical protein
VIATAKAQLRNIGAEFIASPEVAMKKFYPLSQHATDIREWDSFENTIFHGDFQASLGKAIE